MEKKLTINTSKLTEPGRGCDIPKTRTSHETDNGWSTLLLFSGKDGTCGCNPASGCSQPWKNYFMKRFKRNFSRINSTPGLMTVIRGCVSYNLTQETTVSTTNENVPLVLAPADKLFPVTSSTFLYLEPSCGSVLLKLCIAFRFRLRSVRGAIQFLCKLTDEVMAFSSTHFIPAMNAIWVRLNK